MVDTTIRSILAYVLTGAVALAVGFLLARCMFQKSVCGCQRQRQAILAGCGIGVISPIVPLPQPPSSSLPRFTSIPGEVSQQGRAVHMLAKEELLKSPELLETPASILLRSHIPLNNIAVDTVVRILYPSLGIKDDIRRYFVHIPKDIQQWMWDVVIVLRKTGIYLRFHEPDLGVLANLTDDEKRVIQPQLENIKHSYRSMIALAFLLQIGRVIVQEIASNDRVWTYIKTQAVNQMYSNRTPGREQCPGFSVYAGLVENLMQWIISLHRSNNSPSDIRTTLPPSSILSPFIIDAPGNKDDIEGFYTALEDFIRTLPTAKMTQANIEVIKQFLYATCS